MSDYNKSPDQAENLRSRMIDEYKEINGAYPSRSEVHNEKAKKAKQKKRYPLISFLGGVFILLPALVLILFLYYGKDGKILTENNDSPNGETVYLPSEKSSYLDVEDEQESDPSFTEESTSTEETGEDEETTNDTNTADTREVEEDLKVENKTDESSKVEDKTGISTENENDIEYKEVKTHTVGPGETLFNIAIKYYNSRTGEDIIRQYNGINGNEIYVGQELKIPIQ